jgi:hypothetical protein
MKVHGHKKQKLLFALSCFLIVPIFKRKKMEVALAHTMETLSSYRHNILRTIKFRQAALKELVAKYKKSFKSGMVGVLHNITTTSFTFRTMIQLEIQITGIYQMITTDITNSKALMSDFSSRLSMSAQELGNLIHAYHSIYRKLQVRFSSFPWHMYLKVFNYKQFELHSD